MTGVQISYEEITSILREEVLGACQLWNIIKPIFRNIESHDGFLKSDYSIKEKTYFDISEIVKFYYNYS